MSEWFQFNEDVDFYFIYPFIYFNLKNIFSVLVNVHEVLHSVLKEDAVENKSDL